VLKFLGIHRYIFIIICSQYCSHASAQAVKDFIDYHVHIFSPALIENLKKERFGSDLVKGDPNTYSDIRTILNLNPASKLLLISTGYGYRLHHVRPEEQIPLILREQNYLSNIADQYPDRLIPFYGINPRSPYALVAIKRCHTLLNFVGIKLHFSASQVDFRDEEHIDKLKDIFAYTGQHQIPVLLHFSNHRSDFGEKEVIQFFHDIIDPDVPQTIIFAHMGGGGWITERSIITIEAILSQIESSIGSPHNIYFELSGIIHEKWNHQSELSDDQKRAIIRRIGLDKILFGSDYPVARSESYLSTLQERLKLSGHEIKVISQNDIFAEK